MNGSPAGQEIPRILRNPKPATSLYTEPAESAPCYRILSAQDTLISNLSELTYSEQCFSFMFPPPQKTDISSPLPEHATCPAHLTLPNIEIHKHLDTVAIPAFKTTYLKIRSVKRPRSILLRAEKPYDSCAEGHVCYEALGNSRSNPLNAELNPICHLLALLGAHPILHVSRIRVKVCNTKRADQL